MVPSVCLLYVPVCLYLSLDHCVLLLHNNIGAADQGWLEGISNKVPSG